MLFTIFFIGDCTQLYDMTIKGMFSYSYTYQRFFWCRTIPVSHIGLRYNHVAFLYDTFFFAFFLIETFTVQHK